MCSSSPGDDASGRYTGRLTATLQGLSARSEDEQRRAGYRDTLREILQQPETWVETERLVRSSGVAIPASTRAIVFTGSGSSEYAGACAVASLQRELAIAVSAVGGGAILADPRGAVPPIRPCLMVSLARSGNSPESCGVIETLREIAPDIQHLAITCNPDGRLAKMPGIQVLLLPERTHDASFVMTSSVTNLVLASRLLGRLDTDAVAAWSSAAAGILKNHSDTIADIARSGFRRAVYLGTGDLFGAAREGALKMMEMTAGRVMAMAETWLGVRHGPMSAIDHDTLIVGFISVGEPARAFELDVLASMKRKGLGATTLLAGDVTGQRADALIQSPDTPMPAILVSQLLAFFRCLSEGLKPDSPSPDGVITRVVESFSIHKGGSRP